MFLRWLLLPRRKHRGPSQARRPLLDRLTSLFFLFSVFPSTAWHICCMERLETSGPGRGINLPTPLLPCYHPSSSSSFSNHPPLLRPILVVAFLSLASLRPEGETRVGGHTLSLPVRVRYESERQQEHDVFKPFRGFSATTCERGSSQDPPIHHLFFFPVPLLFLVSIS